MIDWVNLASTLVVGVVASFSGAYVAFALQKHEKRTTREQKNIAAITRVLMTLAQQATILATYQKNHINPHREKPECPFLMTAIMRFDPKLLRIDATSLDFLFLPNERQIVLDLVRQELLFIDTFSAIDQFSRFKLSTIDPPIMAAGLADGRAHTVQEYSQAAGPILTNALMFNAAQVVTFVDEGLKSVEDLIAKIGAIAEARFPGKLSIAVSTPDGRRLG